MLRDDFEQGMAEVRRSFEVQPDGLLAVQSRTALVDRLLLALWNTERLRFPGLERGVALFALGGYGRGQLFPYSDVDLLFVVEKSRARDAKDGIRAISQTLWDAGMRVASTTRMPGECDHFEPGNAEFSFALLDCRPLAGDPATTTAIVDRCIARLLDRDRKRMARELTEMTRTRHARYGDTLFHLEPNLKDCPGGLRDAHVAGWLRRLRGEPSQAPQSEEIEEALGFLAAARCFLHFRHERDDNVLDWQAQDAAAGQGIGLGGRGSGRIGGAAHWMRIYFRHARAIDRSLQLEAELSGLKLTGPIPRVKAGLLSGFGKQEERLALDRSGRGGDEAAGDPDTVLGLFASMAQTGAGLSAESERSIADAIPRLSSRLEEGRDLWRAFRPILLGRRAGLALRAMHALGLLELILPEFHGIDALVIRDAYHRYTVDEHTFVLIDTLHDLAEKAPAGAPDWRTRLGAMLGDLHHPELLYLGALLHDTGKARAGENHAHESALLAENVLARFALDAFESSMVLQLIETHLEMSAALRRDIFDRETVRGFASKVQTHESLRMLALFTYADIAAVHPDALTPWKAENLWRLSMATSNELDRHVDEERVSISVGSGERTSRVLALAAERPGAPPRAVLESFLDGLPERYLRTRAPEVILEHAAMSARCSEGPIQLALQTGELISELTLVTPDRPQLFADVAGALTAWGMNVITVDAFSNAAGMVVDTFRFADTFRTLALNAEERNRFLESVRDLLAGRASLEKLLAGRRRARPAAPRFVVETTVEFDATASAHSTLLQVVAQDVPGLLRAISLGLSEAGCNVEVALVDTEGETAIDVFYITRDGGKLTRVHQRELRAALLDVIEENRQPSTAA